MTGSGEVSLGEFLLARLAEDAAVAHAAALYGPEWDDGGPGAIEDARTVVASDGALAHSGRGVAEAEPHALPHIARWDPARVLAEINAKRRMVTALSEESAEHWGPREVPEREWEWCPKVRTAEFCQGTDLEWGPGAPCECAASWPDHRRTPLLRLLAAPYVGHPDFRAEWKP